MDHLENECVVVASEMDDLADRWAKCLEDVRSKDSGYGVAVGITIDRVCARSQEISQLSAPTGTAPHSVGNRSN